MTSLNHIGIAVSKLPELQKLFALLDLKSEHVESIPDQGVKAHFIDLPTQQSHLELLEVTDPHGKVAQFIAKRGPGIHHLSFLLDKGALLPTCEKLRQAGYRLTYDQPQKGAHQMLINFIHPASAGGILIELMEPQA